DFGGDDYTAELYGSASNYLAQVRSNYIADLCVKAARRLDIGEILANVQAHPVLLVGHVMLLGDLVEEAPRYKQENWVNFYGALLTMYEMLVSSINAYYDERTYGRGLSLETRIIMNKGSIAACNALGAVFSVVQVLRTQEYDRGINVHDPSHISRCPSCLICHVATKVITIDAIRQMGIFMFPRVSSYIPTFLMHDENYAERGYRSHGLIEVKYEHGSDDDAAYEHPINISIDSAADDPRAERLRDEAAQLIDAYIQAQLGINDA
ncbi:MAG: hypothetical protein ACO3BC_08490, partial [Ilumatobacteraceae bacterium]